MNAGDDYSQHAHDRGKTGGVAQSDEGPAAAGGGAAADHSGAAATQSAGAKTKRGLLRERMKRAPWWSNFIGVLALLLAIAATVLLILDETSIAVAGYVLSIAGVAIGAIPLFRG